MSPVELFYRILLIAGIIIIAIIIIIIFANKISRIFFKIPMSNTSPTLLDKEVGVTGLMVPKTPIDLIERLIFQAGSQQRRGKMDPSLYRTHSTYYDARDDFRLLQILYAYRDFSEKGNLPQVILPGVDDLLLSLEENRDLGDIACYYDLYSFLRYILEVSEENKLPGLSRIKVFGQLPQSFSTKANLPVIANIRRDAQNLLESIPLLISITSVLIKVDPKTISSQGALKKEIRNFKPRLTDIINNHLNHSESFFETETRFWREYVGFLEDEVDEILDKTEPERLAHEVPENDFPLILFPQESEVEIGRQEKIVFTILNKSEFLCSKVFVDVPVWEDGILSPQGKKDQGDIKRQDSKQFSLEITPHGNERELSLFLNIGYSNSNEGRLASRQIQVKINFKPPKTEVTESTARSSPYQTEPVPEKIIYFVGRRKDKNRIIGEIRSKISGQIIGLFGLARVGKTAMLYEIMENSGLEDQNVFVYYNMDDHPRTISHEEWLNLFLDNLFEKIKDTASEAGLHISSRFETKKDRSINLMNLVTAYHKELEKQDKFLVLIIDEYQRIEENFDNRRRSKDKKRDVVRLFKQLGVETKRVTLILSGYHDIYTLRKYDSYWSDYLAKGFMSFQMGMLRKEEALQLISEPMQANGIKYESSEIPMIIYGMTVGFPWYIQLICKLLFELLEIEETELTNTITHEHLDLVIDEIIKSKSYEEFFFHLFDAQWAGPLAEAIVVAIAHVNSDEAIIISNEDLEVDRKDFYMHYVSISYLEEQLKDYEINPSKKNLIDMLESLYRKEILIRRKIGEEFKYSINIPLMRKYYLERGNLQEISIRVGSPVR